MTGTSLDGIDVAICEVDDTSVDLVAFSTIPYPDDVFERIRRLLNTGTASLRDVSSLEFDLARAYASALRSVVDPTTLDAVGVHGQTMWHEPPLSTWQAGNVSVLATLLETTVVGDMRTADVADGGQGAPLVPLFDEAMFRQDTEATVCLNIGGMANMTILPPRQSPGDSHSSGEVIAFDCGPGNVLINAAVKLTFGKSFDSGGAIAEAGRPIRALCDEILAHPWLALDPPKSTGREVFNDELAAFYVKKYAHPSMPSEDVVRTITEATALIIADHVRRYASSAQRIIVSGGGVHNSVIMSVLASTLPAVDIIKSDDVGIPSDAKEAMCWAWLADRTLRGLPSNIPSVTGARRPHVLGVVARP